MAKISHLKKRLDSVFSQYIRLFESDEYGMCLCCTCEKRLKWSEGDCGHYIHRALNSSRYYEKNCHFQCRTCNRGGNVTNLYTLFLTKTYGDDIIRELAELEKQHKKFTDEELRDLINLYSKKVEQLKKEKGL